MELVGGVDEDGLELLSARSADDKGECYALLVLHFAGRLALRERTAGLLALVCARLDHVEDVFS